MSINIKEELLIQFQDIKFGKNLSEEEQTLISNFYDFLKRENLDDQIRKCEIKLGKLLKEKYE